ncbi:ferredoxin [Nocardioides aquiterrae]|uniref:Ferredoxin n=1 Tax=Nocardioides aquiterrae TaxID=203799 RepID=A0ABP4F1P8_9ACTN
MRIEADVDVCEAYGECVAAAPALFAINDENFVEVLDASPQPDQAAAAERAVWACPVHALSIAED